MLINHCHVGSKGFGEEPDKPEMGTLLALQRILTEAGVEGAQQDLRRWYGFAGPGGGWVTPDNAFARAEAKVNEILAEHHPTPLTEEQERAVQEVVARADRDLVG